MTDAQDPLRVISDAITPLESCYTEPDFGYLLYRHSFGYAVVAAHLLFSPTSLKREPQQIEVGNFVGYRGNISSLGVDIRSLFHCIRNRKFPSIGKQVTLYSSPVPGVPLEPIRVKKSPSHPTNQQRTVHWDVEGLTKPAVLDDANLWSLRGGTQPYFDLDDLLVELGLSGTDGFKITMLPPVVIDVSSEIKGGQAVINCLSSANLDREKLGLSLVTYARDRSPVRISVDMSTVSWSTESSLDGVLRGCTTIPSRDSDLARCFVSFDGVCQHWFWISDAEKRRNNLRAIVEAVDPKLRKTRELLQLDGETKNSDGFEDAVSSVLIMLGFVPFQPGKQMTDAADIYAVAANGDVLVVECTLGDMKANRGSKIQILIDRTRSLRQSLNRAGFSHLSCVPVAVSGRDRLDLKDDTQICERDGIALVSRDEIDGILELTLSSPDSIKRLGEIREKIEAAREQNEVTTDSGSPPGGASGMTS
jgi:hypothetical protein